MGENPYKLFAIYSSIIFLLPATLFGGYLLGSWLDSFLGTTPWLMYIGLLIGGITGLWQTFQLLNRTADRKRSGKQ